jgi:hypothetical protein
MSRRKSCISALSALIFAGLTPSVVQADPVDIAKLDTTALRAFFHSPIFDIVCPLAVYDEDYTNVTVPNQSTAGPRRAEATPSNPNWPQTR